MTKKKRGRPPKYTDPQEIQQKIDKYFADCAGNHVLKDGEPVTDKNGLPVMAGTRPPTITGLAYALGFSSRSGLLNYQGKKPFSDIISRAKLRVEQYAEERLYDREGLHGAEFNLKYNFKWAEETSDVADAPDESGAGVVIIPEVTEESDE